MAKPVSQDQTDALREQVRQAAADQAPIRIEGRNSKAFYGRATRGSILTTREHRGILSHEPTELTITARSGTPLREIEAALAEHRQVLAFEPPCFAGSGTLGGAIASGLSGPSRPFLGAARDFVLGACLINGQGQRLRFGGEVMKNVAGYDVSRLLAGSMGTLGLITEVSLKVLPKPRAEMTLVQEASRKQAITRFTRWCGMPIPLSGACWHQGKAYLRLAGAGAAVKQAGSVIGGERLEQVEPGAESWWSSIRNHSHAFFHSIGPLWRLSVPPAAPANAVEGECLIDWAGAQRWLQTNVDADEVFRLAAGLGGHATLFRGGDRSGEVFQPMEEPLFRLQKSLKHAMDPNGIFNPGRMYESL